MSGFFLLFKYFDVLFLKKLVKMNNFMVPSAPEFYVTKYGFLPWFRIKGAPFPYSHLPPPNISRQHIELSNNARMIQFQEQSSHHADSNIFVKSR